MMNWKNELNRICPELGPKVRAFFTEREGGVSSGPWGGVEGIMGLNVGARTGDNAGCVRMNRSIVEQLCPSPIHWMHQVHGTRVVEAREVDNEELEADAQIAFDPETVCVVQVADCLPVLLADKQARAVAAVHAGWKGLAAGVIEEAVKAIREKLPACELKAWLGPRIGFEDFEVGDEVLERFKKAYPTVTDGVKEKENGKFCLSLAAYARAALAGVGVTEVEDCGLSTAADARRFYSYRRDGERTGRHAAVIWIEK